MKKQPRKQQGEINHIFPVDRHHLPSSHDRMQEFSPDGGSSPNLGCHSPVIFHRSPRNTGYPFVKMIFPA
jgi:hypothetical protein